MRWAKQVNIQTLAYLRLSDLDTLLSLLRLRVLKDLVDLVFDFRIRHCARYMERLDTLFLICQYRASNLCEETYLDALNLGPISFELLVLTTLTFQFPPLRIDQLGIDDMLYRLTVDFEMLYPNFGYPKSTILMSHEFIVFR